MTVSIWGFSNIWNVLTHWLFSLQLKHQWLCRTNAGGSQQDLLSAKDWQGSQIFLKCHISRKLLMHFFWWITTVTNRKKWRLFRSAKMLNRVVLSLSNPHISLFSGIFLIFISSYLKLESWRRWFCCLKCLTLSEHKFNQWCTKCNFPSQNRRIPTNKGKKNHQAKKWRARFTKIFFRQAKQAGAGPLRIERPHKWRGLWGRVVWKSSNSIHIDQNLILKLFNF